MIYSNAQSFPTNLSLMNKSPSNAWFLLIFVMIVWGVNWPIMKVGLQFMAPLPFVAARLFIAFLACSILLLYLKRFKLPQKQDYPIVLGVGIMQFAAFTLLVTTGLEYVNAGRAALLAYTTPLWVTPAANIFLKEKLSPLKLLGVAIGLCGILTLFNPFAFDWNDSNVVKGNALLIIAAFIWALSIVHVRQHKWHGSVLELAPWQILVSLLIVLPVTYFNENRATIWNVELTAILIFNGIFATAGAMWASVRMTQLLPAVTVSLGLLLVPVMGVTIATVWLKEPFSVSLGIGMGLIVLGLLFQLNRLFKK